MPVSIAALKTELTTDPKALGYVGKSDYECSVLLNTAGASSETVFRALSRTCDLVAGVIRAEFDALTTANKDYLRMVFAVENVKTDDATLRTQIAQIFGAGTTSRANLTALASRPAARAEILFGVNTSVSDGDVAAARALP